MNLEDLNIGIVVQLKNLKTTEKEVETFTEKVKESTDRINDTKTNQSIGNWNKNFKKLNKTLGIFIGSLFTVRGIWFALRKAMTSYLSQNDELKSKLDGLYYAVGSMFAPLLEYLANGLVRIIAYVDVLAKAMGLAGMNMANFNKNTNKAKKSLMGIDEINNIGSNEGSSSGANPFANVELDQSWVKILKDVGTFLKPIVDILNETDFATLVKTIGEIVSAFYLLRLAINLVKLGLTGWESLGIVAILVFVGKAIFDIIKFLADPTWENFKTAIESICNAILVAGVVLAVMTGSWIPLVVSAVAFIVGYLYTNWDAVQLLLGKIVARVKEDFGKVKTAIVEFNNKVKTAVTDLVNYVIGKIEGMVNKCIDGINGLTSGLRNLGNKALGFLGIDFELKAIPNITIPRLATGTNYVPNDQLAMIHKGEAVVPKKFNSSEFFGETSAEELNLLSAINEQLIELNNKNYTINLDGENVAKKIDNSLQQLKQRQGVRVFEVAR